MIAGSIVVCYGPADRFLGMLCAVLKRWDSAARHFDAANDLAVRQRDRPCIAHIQYCYAQMLLERRQSGDPQRARRLLKSAQRFAEILGMKTLSARVSDLERSGDSRPQRCSHPGGLSQREAQVLRLIAAGKSNQEIADAIFRSPNTVANHVRSILVKLGAANRTEAATLAARNGLV